MLKALFALIVFACCQLHASDDSLWGQMQKNSSGVFLANVQDVQLEGLQVTYEKLGDSDSNSPVVETFKVCRDDAAVNENNYTEADRAMAIHLRVQAFLTAKNNKQPLKIGLRGPWHPCIYPVSL